MSEELIAGKYYCLGRVITSGYKKNQDGPPSDPNNPKGWNTGQWIDIELLEVSSVPAKFSRALFQTGEIVRGFWSYGGDNGILGKPTAGDIVGYFEAPYAHIWEKTITIVSEKPIPHANEFERELPETQSVISVIYLWLVIVASFVALVIGVLETFGVIHILSLPSWFFPFSVLVSALWIVASRALLNRQELGLTLFSACAFSFSVILFNAGLSMPISILCSTSIIPLLAIRVWEEHNVISDTSLVRLLEYAIKQEKIIPPRGLMAYEKFQKANNETHPPIFIAGLLGFPIAYLIAYFVDKWVSNYNALITVVVLCIVGAGPLMYMHYRQNRRTSIRRVPKLGFWDIPFLTWAVGLTLVIVLFADAIQAVWIVLIAAVVMIAGLLPYNLYRFYYGMDVSLTWGFPPGMADSYKYAIGAVVVLLATLFYFSDARLFPLSPKRFWREFKTGLDWNSGFLFDYLINGILAALLLGTATRYEFLYTDWLIGTIAYLISGAMLGFELSKFRVNDTLEGLAELGRLRCMLKLEHEIEADFYYYHLRDEIMVQPEPIPTTFSAIGIKMVHGSESDFREAINYAEEQSPKYTAYESLIRESIALTKSM